MPRMLALAACAVPVLLGAAPAHATVIQRAAVTYDLDILLFDEATDTGGPIGTAIGGTAFGDFGQASAAVGPAGDLGLSAQQFRTGNLSTTVGIRNSVIPNLTGADREARANFIIDGGNLALVGGENSRLEFELILFAQIFAADDTPFATALWNTFVEIEERGAPDGRVTTIAGEDIGAAPSPTVSFQVDIPLSFQTFDIGLVPANGYVDLAYGVTIESSIVGFAEVVRWQFSDPLSIDGASAFPTVTFRDAVTPVPVPSLAGLLGLAVAGLVAGARRRGA